MSLVLFCWGRFQKLYELECAHVGVVYREKHSQPWSIVEGLRFCYSKLGITNLWVVFWISGNSPFQASQLLIQTADFQMQPFRLILKPVTSSDAARSILPIQSLPPPPIRAQYRLSLEKPERGTPFRR
jgi:hypothetical protein